MGRSSAPWGVDALDLPEIERVIVPASRAALPGWEPGMAWLGGGTWLFSEPQPGLRALVDLEGMAWPALDAGPGGLRIAATCTIAALEAFVAPAGWRAAALIPACCNALLGSFKVWNTATVGGNVCLSLPAAPMVALTVALEGVATIWMAGGGERSVPMREFTTGPQQTVLAPGELLRCIDLPAKALARRAAMRQVSLTALGRSAALLVATRTGAGGFTLTITASTPRPVHIAWPGVPDASALDGHIAAFPDALWYDDVHGAPAWRRHMTRRLAAELLAELSA